jgi:hypothetical protein
VRTETLTPHTFFYPSLHEKQTPHLLSWASVWVNFYLRLVLEAAALDVLVAMADRHIADKPK